MNQKDFILILDFGSQYTQLIAKKIRKISCLLRNSSIQYGYK